MLIIKSSDLKSLGIQNGQLAVTLQTHPDETLLTNQFNIKLDDDEIVRCMYFKSRSNGKEYVAVSPLFSSLRRKGEECIHDTWNSLWGQPADYFLWWVPRHATIHA